MTGEVLLPTPVSASWGPALIHFCPWAPARKHASKSIGCPLMGQTLFFSTGACRVGENVQLAGLTCQPIFTSLGNSIKAEKYLEFLTLRIGTAGYIPVEGVNTSFNSTLLQSKAWIKCSPEPEGDPAKCISQDHMELIFPRTVGHGEVGGLPALEASGELEMACLVLCCQLDA